MPVTKKKISELPLAETFKGLYTIGVSAQNKSTKVNLEFVKTSADEAQNAATKAISAADEARSAADKVDAMLPGNIVVDKIRSRDIIDEFRPYTIISMNRPRNYTYFIGGSYWPIMPVFECRYEPGDPATISSKWSVADDTNLIVTANAKDGLIKEPIKVNVFNITVPFAPENSNKRKLYIREVNNADVTLTQLDDSKGIIEEKTFDTSQKSFGFEIDDRTHFINLTVSYSSYNWCTKLSVFCTNIGYDRFFNNPDEALYCKLKGMLLRKNRHNDKYDIITLHDSIRYVSEKSAYRIFDRAECRFIQESIDVANYVKVLFGKTLYENNPYLAIQESGSIPQCGRIGVFVHTKWRHRIFNRSYNKGVPGSGRHRSRYSLAERGNDELPSASDATKMLSGMDNKILRKYFTHVDWEYDTKYRTVRYISCFVSVYKINSPVKSEKGKQQSKIPIGRRIYFRICNRQIVDKTGAKDRKWIVEE